MNIEFDPYVILGTSADASFDEIKDAHRRAVRRLHSDTNPNKGALAQLQDINVSYRLLSDPDKRRQYDEQAKRTPQRKYDFTLRITSSKRVLQPLPEAQVVYILVEILPDPKAREQQEQIQR